MGHPGYVVISQTMGSEQKQPALQGHRLLIKNEPRETCEGAYTDLVLISKGKLLKPKLCIVSTISSFYCCVLFLFQWISHYLLRWETRQNSEYKLLQNWRTQWNVPLWQMEELACSKPNCLHEKIYFPNSTPVWGFKQCEQQQRGDS